MKRSGTCIILAALAVAGPGCDSGDAPRASVNVEIERSGTGEVFRLAWPSDESRPLVAEPFAADVLSDDQWQWRISFTPDERFAYFSVSEGWFPRTRQASIMRARRDSDGGWHAPELAPFSGRHSDMDPFITPDGKRLYFSSSRPVDGEPRGVFDIWYLEREGESWGEPVRLGAEINSDRDELYASASADGTLYFASGPTGPGEEGSWNIYSAKPAGDSFAPRARLPGVNVEGGSTPDNPFADWDFNPEISPDGQLLFFTSLRPGGHGFGDIYVSRRQGDAWSEPVNLGPCVNTEHDEYHPSLSPDGKTLYFVRARFRPETVPGNFYSIPLASLPLELSPAGAQADECGERPDRYAESK
jgi:hypothetical protein